MQTIVAAYRTESELDLLRHAGVVPLSLRHCTVPHRGEKLASEGPSFPSPLSVLLIFPAMQHPSVSRKRQSENSGCENAVV